MKRLVLETSAAQIVRELRRDARQAGKPDVQELRERLRLLEAPRPVGDEGLEEAPSSGCAALDGLLPTGGFPRGSLVEWLADEASGAGMLAMLAAREASIESANKAIVVLDRRRNFYPPAAAALGVDLERAIVVRARSDAEELWALDQILRCPGVAAVWGPIAKIDPRWFRRLQLAAEEGGVLGLLLRPASVRGRPSWSWAQIGVTPLAVANLAADAQSVANALRGAPPVANALRGVRGECARTMPSESSRGAANATEGVRYSATEGVDDIGVTNAGAVGRRWRVELIRCRAKGVGQQQKHNQGQGPLEVELDRATGVVHLVREPNRDPETHSLRLAAELVAGERRRAAAS